MARYKSRSHKSSKRNKSRSRKQHGGGLIGDFFSGIGEKFQGLFKKSNDTANPPVATASATPAPDTKPTQSGGARKKTKKRHHRRHRK
jgi:hypothetical protein